KKQCQAQRRLAEAFGKKEPREYETEVNDEALEKQIFEAAYQKCYDIAKQGTQKHERTEAFNQVKEEILAGFSEEELEEKAGLVSRYFGAAHKKAVRDLILKEGVRLDGRKTEDIRPIWCEV